MGVGFGSGLILHSYCYLMMSGYLVLEVGEMIPGDAVCGKSV